MNKIIINRGSFKLNEFVFEQGTTTIGRASDNTISLDDASVSSQHARIVTLLHTSYIEDLDSTNGTFVNGKAVHKQSLRSGDVIALGNHELLFQSDDSAKKIPETAETVVLRDSDIKRKLTELMQSQSAQQGQKAPGPGLATEPYPSASQPLPASLLAAAGLDEEKTEAWLEEKSSTNVTTDFAEEKSAGRSASPAPEIPTGSSSAEHPTAAQTVLNTPGAVGASAKSAPAKAGVPTVTAPANGTNVTSTVRPESTPGIASTTQSQDRHRSDSIYASDTVAPNHGKPQGAKVMPMIWMFIVAVLVAELIYIIYRWLG
jgi:pSer/pThr/pTyr-binding forkhead associated (FHA) protein